MWILTDMNTGMVYEADKGIQYNYEQLFLDLGLSVQINQPDFPGDSLSVNNGLILSYALYQDSSQRWISGVADIDLPGSPQDWIRAGTYQDQGNANFNDWNMPDAYDPEAVYEKINGGTWAPYVMVAHNSQSPFGPAFNSLSKTQSPMADIASVDIVFTADKSKWTRSMIIEQEFDNTLTEGGVERFDIRAGQSVDKDGNPAEVGSGPSDNPNDPNYISETGFGWFPGYAINLETGERLNIIFGENSWLVGENGRDMLYNPTSNVTDFFGNPLFGGFHTVYVMNHNNKIYKVGSTTLSYQFPAYDGCRYMKNFYDSLRTNPNWTNVYGSILWSTAMWVGMPLSIDGVEWLPEGNDWTLSTRMAQPYKRYFSTPNDSLYYSTDSTVTYWPAYSFKTEGVATQEYSSDKFQSDLDQIRVVPNPYYAYTSYENNALDNRIKITNLPQQATVTIYNVNGTLVRQLTKDSQETYMDWDLKNFAGIPIAGGIYIIHVNTMEGERVLKWFGILRPPDLNTF
jgi:hypothetical protein